jgi:hypothetical protein
MLTLIIEGGFAMFFLLGFGFATLVAATRYAWSVTPVGLRLTLGLGVVTLFTTLMGICVDFAAVGHGVWNYVKKNPGTSLNEALLQGVAESLAPGVLGFSFLALAALITTVGLYRTPEL